MPAFQIGVDPFRHWQNLIERSIFGSTAESQRNHVAYDTRVERVARERNTFRSKNPVCAIAAGARSNTHQRKVAGAAAKIPDQDKFVVVECALVEVGRGDRLIFEGHWPD